MQMRKLGTEGPEISVVGFGSWEAGGSGWGAAVPDNETIAAMHAGFDAGMTWIDTAEIYGMGRSEELVGRAVQGRDDVMVFTKVGASPAGSGLKPDEIRRAVRGSLDRLGRDHIDLYQVHWPDRSVSIEDTWGTMAELVDEGLVRYIGVSNFPVKLIERCEEIRHVDGLQSQFSMLRRRLRDEVFPFCRDNGTGVLCYGPLAYGLLTGAITKDTVFDDNDWRSGKGGETDYYESLFSAAVFDNNLAIVEQLRSIAEKEGSTLPQLALAWALHHDWCSAVIAGSRSAPHTRENATAGDGELSVATVTAIEELLID